MRLEDFKSTNGPDLRVYLASHPDPKKSADVKDKGFVDLGGLKGNIGNQNYPIPASADLSKPGSIVIWRRSFSVIFRVASLKEATPRRALQRRHWQAGCQWHTA